MYACVKSKWQRKKDLKVRRCEKTLLSGKEVFEADAGELVEVRISPTATIFDWSGVTDRSAIRIDMEGYDSRLVPSAFYIRLNGIE